MPPILAEAPEGYTPVPLARGKTKESAVPQWLTDHKVWWRHPLARLFIAWMILVLDMWLFCEDPVNDSHVEAVLPGVGHLWSFFVIWPAGGLAVLRALLILVSLVVGCYVGRQQVHHRLLRDRWQLYMFSECKGTWFVMGIFCVLSSLVFVGINNLLFTSVPNAQVQSNMKMEMNDFARLAQTGSVGMDMVAIVLVTDAILQDRVKYPDWAPGLKRIYVTGWNGWLRVVIVWAVLAASAVMVPLGIWSSGTGDGQMRYEDTAIGRLIGGMSEVQRAALVSTIVFCDLVTVVQDWDFPTFSPPLDIPLDEQVLIAGTFTSKLHCECLERPMKRLWRLCDRLTPSCFGLRSEIYKQLPDASFFHISVTGKWLTYGPLLGVVFLDIMCTRTQLTYDPSVYGQYVNPADNRVWAITNEELLRSVYVDGVLVNKTQVSWPDRSSMREHVDVFPPDVETSSVFLGSSLKYLTALPGLIFLLSFGFLIWAANYQPERLTQAHAEQLLKDVQGQAAASAAAATAAATKAAAATVTTVADTVTDAAATVGDGLKPLIAVGGEGSSSSSDDDGDEEGESETDSDAQTACCARHPRAGP